VFYNLSLSIDRERQQDISGIPLLTPAFGGKQTGKQKADLIRGWVVIRGQTYKSPKFDQGPLT